MSDMEPQPLFIGFFLPSDMVSYPTSQMKKLPIVSRLNRELEVLTVQVIFLELKLVASSAHRLVRPCRIFRTSLLQSARKPCLC